MCTPGIHIHTICSDWLVIKITIYEQSNCSLCHLKKHQISQLKCESDSTSPVICLDLWENYYMQFTYSTIAHVPIWQIWTDFEPEWVCDHDNRRQFPNKFSFLAERERLYELVATTKMPPLIWWLPCKQKKLPIKNTNWRICSSRLLLIVKSTKWFGTRL